MNRLPIFLNIVLFLCCKSYGQQTPAQFREVNEIVLNDDTYFTLTDIRSSRLERQYKVQILDNNAKDLNIIRLPYNKFERVNSLKAVVYNSAGKQIKRYSLKDCQDISMGIGAVATDSRLKYLEINFNQYPYTIEVEYRIDFKESMFFPVWQPIESDKVRVQAATLIVKDLQNTGFRYREYLLAPPEITKQEKGTQYVWKIKDTGPIKSESFNYSPQQLFPIVYLGARDFEVDGYKGNMESWQNYGRWINLVCKNKNDLQAEDITEVKKLCAPLDNTRDKVKAIYKYVQQHTRYVSIQLGIGGWQPFNTHFVHEKKYGDCKALSFYTKSLLEAVGIPAYYTVIRAGEEAQEPIPDFPWARFNHIIVTVPLEQDTLWLECTSNISPPGFLGTFTSNRYCLLVDEQGGRLIKTKAYTEKESTENTSVVLDFCSNPKEINFSLLKKFSGTEIEKNGLSFTLNKEEREKKKWIQDHIHFGSVELQDYSFLPLTGEVVPVTGYQIKGLLKNFCQQTGSRYFFTPFRFTTLPDYDLPNQKRVSPISVRYPFTQSDTIRIRMPKNMKPENLFYPQKLQTQFGYYQTGIQRTKDTWLFTRTFCLKAGKYPPEDYQDFRKFIQDVQLGDKIRVVFVEQ